MCDFLAYPFGEGKSLLKASKADNLKKVMDITQDADHSELNYRDEVSTTGVMDQIVTTTTLLVAQISHVILKKPQLCNENCFFQKLFYQVKGRDTEL